MAFLAQSAGLVALVYQEAKELVGVPLIAIAGYEFGVRLDLVWGCIRKGLSRCIQIYPCNGLFHGCNKAEKSARME
jgi:hypothetical protein